MVKRSSTSRGPKFPAKSAPAPRVSPKGGHNLGTPMHCPTKRAAPNLRRY